VSKFGCFCAKERCFASDSVYLGKRKEMVWLAIVLARDDSDTIIGFESRRWILKESWIHESDDVSRSTSGTQK
jgi:hypothetical protein